MKYVSRAKRSAPKSEDWVEDTANLTGQVVIEDSDGWSGLYDAEGRELWRVREVGFRLRDD